MSQSTQTTSVLRQRMIDDMRMRKLSDKTQSHYNCDRQIERLLCAIVNSQLRPRADIQSSPKRSFQRQVEC